MVCIYISVKFIALRSFSFKCLTSERHMWTEASSETCLYVMSVNVPCVYVCVCVCMCVADPH